MKKIKFCPFCKTALAIRLIGHSYTYLGMKEKDIDWYFEKISHSDKGNILYVCKNCSYCE